MDKRALVALLSLGIYITTTTAHGSEVNSQVGARAEVSTAVSSDPAAQTRGDSDSRRRRSYTARVSWYKHGRVTANGEKFNPNALTVAHRTLPFNTLVRLTNPETHKSIVVRVNDRGPFVRGREFDLTIGAARALGIIDEGVVKLSVEYLVK